MCGFAGLNRWIRNRNTTPYKYVLQALHKCKDPCHLISLDSGWIIVRPPCYPSQLSHHECVAWLFTLVFWKHNLYFLTPSCWKGSSGISFKGEETDLMLLFTKLRFSHVLALGFAFVVCRDSARWVVYCFCHGTNGPQFLNPRKLEQSSHQLINHLYFHCWDSLNIVLVRR